MPSIGREHREADDEGARGSNVPLTASERKLLSAPGQGSGCLFKNEGLSAASIARPAAPVFSRPVS